MSLGKIIGDLLAEHSCVILPDFGGFIANPLSAKIDFEKGIIYPPSLLISFNKNLVRNDGLLISKISEIRNSSLKDAQLFLEKEIQGFYDNIERGNRVEIGNLGYLFQNNEGVFVFEQDRYCNILKASFGMSPVLFNVEAQLSNKSNPKKNPFITITKYVAAAVAIPILFYGFWIPSHTDVLNSGVIYTQDFNPFNDNNSEKYIQKEINTQTNHISPLKSVSSSVESLSSESQTYSYALDDDHYIPVILSSYENNEDNQTDQINDIHLIIGSFSSKQNAQKQVKKLKQKGFNASIVGKYNNLYRVSAVYTNSNQLQTFKTALVDLGYNPWVLKD